MAMVRVSKGDEETPEVGGMVVMGGAVVDEGMAAGIGGMVAEELPDIGPNINTKLLGSLLLPLR